MILGSKLVSYIHSEFKDSLGYTVKSCLKKASQTEDLKTSIRDFLASPKMFGLITKFHDFTDEENKDRVHMALVLTIESNNKHIPTHDSGISIFFFPKSVFPWEF